MESVNHKSLIDRINNGESTSPELTENHKELGNEWRDVDIRAGYTRVEATIKTKTLLRIFRKIFKRKS
mgnify:CR=1 FL=1